MYFRKMKVRSNKIGDIRNHYRLKLLDNYEERDVDTLLFMLIEEFSGISKTRVISEPHLTITESELLNIHFAVKDLNNHKPIQYIIGKTEFYGFPIKVNSNVLIPRQETEELVELVIRENQHRKNLRILDIGTGSGCIAIAISKNLPTAEILAIDISQVAIQTAKSNAQLNEANINFCCLDFLNESNWSKFEFLDIITSNPPYVRYSEKALMKKNVLNFEPEKALFVDDENPLIFYKAIAYFARHNLNKSGKIYCEINQYLGKEIVNLFDQEGFADVYLMKDLNGNDRIIAAKLKE
jgi:release factor glutamine methyltransferase